MKNTASETCEAVTKDLMFVSLLLERNKRGNGIEKKKKNLKKQWLKTSQIWQTTRIYRFVKLSKTPKKMNSIKSTPRYKTAKLLKLKTEQKSLESSERENSNDSDFLIRSHGGQKEVTQQFSDAEKKELSIQNLISRENILQEQKGKSGHCHNEEKQRICCQKTHPKRMLKDRFPSRNETIKSQSLNIRKEKRIW